jgi:REP element-mobilizing transposase RayT
MDKFNNKYRIPSARLQSWDYGANGAYFITICTQNREHLFGEILDTIVSIVETPKLGVSTMQLNEIGQLAEKYWLEIPTHFPFIELGNFVVMPNHTHGILIINKTGNETIDENVADKHVADDHVADDHVVETPNLGVSTGKTTYGGKNEKWKPNTIGSIINQYKRIVTINARKIHADFAWQPRFHDHIIRDAQSFENIQNYITNNPMNWGKDKFYG